MFIYMITFSRFQCHFRRLHLALPEQHHVWLLDKLDYNLTNYNQFILKIG